MDLEETALYLGSDESTGFSPSQLSSGEITDPEFLDTPQFTSSPAIKSEEPASKSSTGQRTRSRRVISSTFSSSESDDCIMETGSEIEPRAEKQAIVLSDTNDEQDTDVQFISSDSSTESISYGFHGGNEKVPIYSKDKNSLSAKQIFKLCFGEFDDRFLCKAKPVSVRYNAVFIVDLNKVDLRSLYADDNGVWGTATPRSHFRVEMSDEKVSKVVVGNKNNYTHILRRQYGKHQATITEKGITFQRIISTVINKNDSKCRYAVVQYIHRDGCEDDIIIEPHGNARKTKRPFYKTEPDVLESIKSEPLHSKPKKIFKTLIDEAGGPIYSSSAASEPRNLQQIYNIRKSQKIESKNDDFTRLLSQVKESSFVHDLTIDADSVQYVLASEKQIKDLELFCTHPLKFSVFSIDSIYDVGNYYVTNTCFDNLKVVHADGKYRGHHPLEMGPQFVHTQRNTNNFVGFFSSLLRMNPSLKDIQAIGTDGDEAIMNACTICFQDAQHLLCATHKKENVRSKLKDYFRAKDPAINHIVSDIFGKDIGSVHEKGLIDCKSSSSFDKKIMDMKATWDCLVPTWDCLVPTFHHWFLRYESDLFKSHLIKEVTDTAHIDGQFSNNRIESVNDNLKDWIGRSGKLSLPVVNSKIEELVQNQQQELEMSVYGTGQYELSSCHEFLRRTRSEWNSMCAEDRKKVLNDFWSSGVAGRVEKDKRPTLAEDSQTRVEQDVIKPNKKLSVNCDQYDINVSKDIIEDIWNKAEQLLCTTDSIVQAPGYDGVFVRHEAASSTSSSLATQPHLVTSNKSGKFTCDCRMYQSAKICQHSVVAAEKSNRLQRFLEWRKKQKIDINITELVIGGIRSGVKSKVQKPRRGGRTPLDKNIPATSTEREPLVVESFEHTLTALDDMEKDEPFELIYLFQTKAQTCYGCAVKFKKEEQNSLIVRKYCQREYSVQGVKKTKLQFAYFHLKSTCVRVKFPDFKKECLVLSKESADLVPKEVKEKLTSFGTRPGF